MRTIEKVLITCIAAVLCWSAYTYYINYDMYRLVGDYNMITGYSTLVERLKDEEWIDATCEEWESSSSPIMSGLYSYLTDVSDVSPVDHINHGRALAGWSVFLSMVSVPLYLFSSALRGKAYIESRRNKNNRR